MQRSLIELSFFKILGLFIIMFLYLWVSFTSFGYDDEFHNIMLIESKYTYHRLYEIVNSVDVHPPGQYFFNKALWDITGNWSFVRVITASFASLTIWFIWISIANQNLLLNVFSFVTICLNPALLLWCTGIRWYAYFVSFFNLLGLLIMRNPSNSLTFWGLFFLLSVVLFMTGYAALILVPVAFGLALHSRKAVLKDELIVIAGFGFISLVVSFPQLKVFAMVHLKNSSSQVSTFIEAIKGLLVHIFSNQGAMPVSFFGISLIIGNSILIFSGIIKFKKISLNYASLIFIFGALGLLMAKLTGKFRNLVTISAFQGVFQAQLFQKIRNKHLMVLVLILLGIGNLGSVYNIFMHTDTTKGSWNTPYKNVLKDLRKMRCVLSCNKIQIITHDPVLAYHVQRQGDLVVFVGSDKWQERIKDFSGCQAAIQTFRGSLTRNLLDQYYFIIDQLPNRLHISKLGYDRFANFKRIFDPDVPDWYVTIIYFGPRELYDDS